MGSSHLRGATVAALLLVCMFGCGEPKAPRRDAGGARYDAKGNALRDVRRPKERPPSLILLVIDTLRADAVALPGEPPALMPALASVAERGVGFAHAAAPSPWTVPSITGLVTGLLPSQHGSEAPLQPARLPAAATTFAEVLGTTYGYVTGAYTDGPWISSGPQSILQGFQYGGSGFALQGTRKILEGFAQDRDPERPFFLLLHTLEAHDPYGAENHQWPHRPLPPGPLSRIDPAAVTEPWQKARHFMLDFRARTDLWRHHGPELAVDVVRYLHGGYMRAPRRELAHEFRDAYEVGVRWVDGLVRETLEQLASWGMLENTLVVITSDHGEAFGEHGILAHGRQLHDELVRIPLVMLGPKPFAGGRTVQASVSLIDILPTFFELAGLDPPTGLQGASFLADVSDDGGGRPVFAEEILNADNTGEDVHAILTSVRTNRWKYIVVHDTRSASAHEALYDLQRDPGEKHALVPAEAKGLDATFCRAVERARDRVWGSRPEQQGLYAGPPAGERAPTAPRRPPPLVPEGTK